jgi:sugar phosphate isomerase/epimerase
MAALPRPARLLLALLGLLAAQPLRAAAPATWNPANLAAWCIVPFDARRRGPEERAMMLRELGIRRYAYDWRAEHVAEFDLEVETMRRQGIEITAWWFPTRLDDTARRILEVIARHKIHPQLWVMGGGAPTRSPAEQAARVGEEAARLRPIVAAAAQLGCTVGLYNHGNWFGEPENQLAVLERLRADGHGNVGLVYNFHHGHGHLGRFADFWPLIQPFVLAVNLNGMVAGGDKVGKKLLYLGEGDRDLDLLRILRASRWQGQLGILNHRTDVDAAEGLRRNRDGFIRLAAQLDPP